MNGRPLANVIASGAEEQRNECGLRLLRLFVSAPERVGRIHGDPHPGNFRLLDDGRLAVLDFGSSEPMPAGWPPALGQLLRAARDNDREALHGYAVVAGLIAPDTVDATDLSNFVDPWMEPLRCHRFHFDRAWLQREARRWSDPRGTAGRLQRKVRIPARHLLVQRVAFGLLGVLTSLDAIVPVRAEVERWIPELR